MSGEPRAHENGAVEPEADENRAAQQAFAKEFARFMDWARDLNPVDGDGTLPLRKRIEAFYGPVDGVSAIVSRNFKFRDLPNVGRVLPALFEDQGWTCELVGYTGDSEFTDSGLAMVLRHGGWGGLMEGPLRYHTLDIAGETTECIAKAVYLFARGNERMVVFVGMVDGFHDDRVRLEVLANTGEVAASRLREIKDDIERLSVYRGAVLSVDDAEGNRVRFLQFPEVQREDLILPADVLETIERNTIGFAQRLEWLRRAGRHLKRGILLHGPPGTGKSLTVQYLVGALGGRTTVVVRGRTFATLRASCEMARLLAPSTVVLEDVDLVAEERTSSSTRSDLFELLNEMEGLEGDLDILFVLTTNQVEVLEPALLARPGRIDQAIEFPLPDADCRRRLIELYGRGMTIPGAVVANAVERTDGTSPAFIKEMLRKAATYAVDREASDDGLEGLSLTEEDIAAALREIFFAGGKLTARLLGGTARAAGFRAGM